MFCCNSVEKVVVWWGCAGMRRWTRRQRHACKNTRLVAALLKATAVLILNQMSALVDTRRPQPYVSLSELNRHFHRIDQHRTRPRSQFSLARRRAKVSKSCTLPNTTSYISSLSKMRYTIPKTLLPLRTRYIIQWKRLRFGNPQGQELSKDQFG